jgi:D-alanyl-D-alanine carboxypeptidase
MQNSAALIREFENFISSCIKKVPSISILAVKNNKTVYKKAFGYSNGPELIKATPKTVYKWWSLTKPFTACAVMQLYEKRLIDLYDPVSRYLDFFRVKYKGKDYSDKIKVINLLNHSSGLKNNMPQVIGWMHLSGENPYNQTEYIKSKFKYFSKLKYKTGEKGLYSNVGHMVLGALIEKVSGRRYEDYIRNNLLKPLEMNNTDFTYNLNNEKVIALGSHPFFSYETLLLPFLYKNFFRRFVKKIENRRLWFNHFYPDSTPPSGLTGPVTDMGNFMRMILNKGKYKDITVLKKETVRFMIEAEQVKAYGLNAKRYKGMAYGPGWKIMKTAKNPYIFHGGAGASFGSMIKLYPGRSLGIAVMANDTNIKRGLIISRLAGLLI